MKVCSVCGESKPLHVFKWKNREAGLRQGQCDPCRKETAKRSYEKNKEKVIRDSIRRGTKQKASYHEWKSQFSCTLCPEDDPTCLDFHHLDPSQKDMEVSSLFKRGSKERFEQELAKCICLCSNCHRKVHANKITLLALV